MAVFMDTGGGDIYGGPTREQVVAEMEKDLGGDFNLDDAEEVLGSRKIALTDENGEWTGEYITLDQEYDESFGTYCVASEN